MVIIRDTHSGIAYMMKPYVRPAGIIQLSQKQYKDLRKGKIELLFEAVPKVFRVPIMSFTV